MQDIAADFIINNNNSFEFEAEISQPEHFDCSFEIFATGGTWGSISGNIEDQTDLQEALSQKADIDYVDSIVSAASDTINSRIDAEVETLNTEINKKVETITGDDFIDITRNGSSIVINSKTFIFEQAIAADTWIINYDWSYKQPSIDIIDSAGNIQLPNDINYATNTITLSFLAAFSGKAYLN